MECKAIHVATVDDLKNPGDFIYTYDGEGNICGMMEKCPCGCGAEGGIRFVSELYSKKNYPNVPLWEWDGNVESPTLTPSIRRTGGCKWHGYLTNGVFKEACE